MAQTRIDHEQTRINGVWRQPPSRQPDADERALGLWIDRIGVHVEHGAALPEMRLIGLHAICAVVSGHGRLCLDDGRGCELASGDAWWLLPDEASAYNPRPNARWRHVSIVCGGSLADVLAAQLRRSGPRLPGLAEVVRRAWSALAALAGNGPAISAQRLAVFAGLCGSLNGDRATPDPRLATALVSLADHGPGPLDCAALARDVNLSPSQLRRLFARHCHCSPVEWLTRSRMQRAEELLARTTLSIQAIAAETGFADAFWFSRVFRRTHGLSPQKGGDN